MSVFFIADPPVAASFIPNVPPPSSTRSVLKVSATNPTMESTTPRKKKRKRKVEAGATALRAVETDLVNKLSHEKMKTASHSHLLLPSFLQPRDVNGHPCNMPNGSELKQNTDTPENKRVNSHSNSKQKDNKTESCTGTDTHSRATIPYEMSTNITSANKSHYGTHRASISTPVNALRHDSTNHTSANKSSSVSCPSLDSTLDEWNEIDDIFG